MPLSRRYFFLGSLAAGARAQKKKAAVERPNIVLVIADDLAAWMLGAYGNKEIRTPNIDQLARTGTRFVNSFVASPICSASRASLFTGRTPRQHGIVDFLTPQPSANPPQGQAGPPASFAREVMVSDLLADAGYECGYSGKWHMGNDDQPQHRFNFWYTMPGGSSPYQDPKMNLNGKTVEEKGYLADRITARAMEFLDRQSASKPFFLTVSHFNPHVPYEGHPQRYYDMYRDAKFDSFHYQPAAPNALREKEMLRDVPGNLRKCAAATTALDDQVGALVKGIHDKGMAEKTLIVFCGDNGFLLGRHGLWSKGHASDPPNMYEEAVRVPMFWSWLGHIPADNTRPEMISFYDFVPSICDVTGVDLPQRNLCGRSYWPLVTNTPVPKKQPWRNLVFAELRNTAMARDARYKLVWRDGGRGPGELYDLRADAQEHTNQYENAQFVNTRDRLAADVKEWQTKYSS